MTTLQPFVLNATQILVGSTAKMNFQNGTTVAFGTGNYQIDDLIGYTKGDSNNMYHWVQWSTKTAPGASNVLNLWASYLGWDSIANYNFTSQLNVMGRFTFSSATAATFVASITAGSQGLGV